MSFAADQEGWCAYHNQVEEYSSTSVQCPECWHIYRDKADVVATELREWPDMWEGMTLTFEMVVCCPLCVHDW